MPRDFANKKSTPKKRGASRKKQQKKPVPVVLWLFTLVLVSALTTGLVYLKWYKPADKTVTNTPTQVETKKSAPSASATSQPDEDIPLYNLHEDLTNKTVEIPPEDLKLPDNLDKYYYSMPCGSFREARLAEELKAKIAMTGNNSDMAAVKYKGETWYRVQLGPFSRKRTAEKVRHRLQDNGIQGCLINRHIKSK